jgi:hypothetical protein
MIKKLCFCSLAVLVMATSVQASVLGGLMHNGENAFQDDSVDQYFDLQAAGAAGAGAISNGDVIVGYMRLDQKFASGPNPGAAVNNQIYIIFSQQIESIIDQNASATVNAYDIEFEATTVAGLTLSDLVGSAMPAGAIAALYEVPGGFPFDYITEFPGNVSATTRTDGIPSQAGADNIFDLIQSIVSNGTLGLVAGFGDNGATDPLGFTAPDFYKAFTQNIAAASDPFANNSLIPGIPPSQQLAGFAAGLTILQNNLPDAQFNELVFQADPFTTDGGLFDITISNASVSGSAAAGFTDTTYVPSFRDQAQVTVNATIVPEPTSFLAWIGLSAIGFVVVNRRSTKS